MNVTPEELRFPMVVVCPNAWQTYGCQWDIGYLWRWTNGLERLAIVVLALMLPYILIVVIRVSHRYQSARRAPEIELGTQNLRKTATELSAEVSSLNSIASVAPYIGLAGTCMGILSVFRGYGMAKQAVIEMIASETAAALLSTAAGILVAVPATCFYNFLRTRIDLLESEVSNLAQALTSGYGHHMPRKFPLTKRFSDMPQFALVAALGLAPLLPAFTSFASFRTPKGFGVEIASACTEGDLADRFTVLHITNAGTVFLNSEQQDWNNLAGRLSEIYSTRAHRMLYLIADDGIPFQKVADAVDIVRNAPDAVSSRPLDITVRLTTPRAMNSRCAELIR
jgi:biopolymer transport protein ExbD